MHAHIVLAHPEPKSFNAQLAGLAAETLRGRGWTATVSDLCALGFDPVEGPRHFRSRRDPDWFRPQDEQRFACEQRSLAEDVRSEIAHLERADLLILQFPMWWFTVPAILKGWLDRVFVYGDLYTGSVRYDRGHFLGRRAMLSLTTGGTEPTFAYNGRNGDIDLLLWPLHFSLYYMGYSVLPPFVAFGVESGIRYSGQEQVMARLENYRQSLRRRLLAVENDVPLAFSGWADWDGNGQLRPGVPGHSPFVRATP